MSWIKLTKFVTDCKPRSGWRDSHKIQASKYPNPNKPPGGGGEGVGAY